MAASLTHPGSRAPRPGRPKAGRLTVSAGLCAAAVTLIAGCGSASSPASSSRAKPVSARQAITLAAATSQKINSATATLNLRETGTTTAVTTGSMQIQVKPSVLMSAALKVAVGGRTEPVTEVLTGNAVYLKVPGMSQLTQKPWVKITLAQLSGRTGVQFSKLLQNLQSGNPLNQSRLLTASKNVHAEGTQVVNGVQTTKYAGSYTAAQARAALPASERKALGPALSQLTGTTDFTVWIDAQHHTRKMLSVEHINGQTVTQTVNITAINQPVSVQAPPASQVASLPKNLGRPGGSAI